MLKTFTQQLDKTTVAVIASVFIITLYTITNIHDMFVDRLIIQDAHTLSKNVADKIRGEFFPGDILENSARKTRSFAKKNNRARSRSFNNTTKDKQYNSHKTIPQFTAKPLLGAPKLKKFFDEHINDHNYLNALDSFAVYLPSGTVYLPQKMFRQGAELKKFTNSYRVVSSVQTVFKNGKSLYAFRENNQSTHTQHFIPLIRSEKVLGVVLLEAQQTMAGAKVANAVSSAVYFTTFAGLPVILLVMYLGWLRFREKMQAQEKISFLALNDHLTELPNRLTFNNILKHTITRKPGSEEKNIAVFSIDIDDFNQINEIIGHEAGDQYLILIAERLQKYKPKGATLSRMSGDEFAVILPEISTPEEASELAKQFLKQIAQPFPHKQEDITCTGSIGIAFGQNKDQEAETILKNAKLALYRAKEDGGNSFRFFEPTMDQALQRRRELEKSLIKALKEEEFELYYQPQVELSDAKIIGYEALLRWNHPEKGMVSPADFIPILEETKMIVEVGEYVLRRACKEALTWENNEKVAVNLSTVQFEHQDVPSMVAKALSDTGLAAERLEIEITESTLMSDTDAALVMLEALKKLGVNIAMDDFGTGYSSLSYISEFEFDKIKIDRSFVASIQNDERARAIITTIIGLGRALDIMITAEGIETNEQLLLIQAAGCNFGQGYLFGRPVPLSEIIDKQSAEANLEETKVNPALISSRVA
jgi:diguanylate cyclase (GGDEF)-like protein